LFQRINNHLSFEQKDVFLQNFYSYIHYDNTCDFVVDVDVVWDWLGYTSKGNAKRLLKSKFTQDIDYKVIYITDKTFVGGHNKETILMNVNTFKKFCLKSETKKADEIHDYFIKMEEIMFEHTKEQLKTLVTEKDKEILALKQSATYQLPFEPTPYQELAKDQTLYVLQQIGDKNPNLFKIGETTDLKKRTQQYKTGSSQGFNIVFEYKTHNSKLLEHLVKQLLFRYKYGNQKITKNGTEWYECRLQHIINIISAAGACIDTLMCTRSSIEKTDMAKYLFKTILTNLFNDKNELSSIVPELKDPLQDAYNNVTRNIKKKLKKALSKSIYKEVSKTVVDDIHTKVNTVVDDMLNELNLDE
jgi:phage anti-repressor protein